MNLTASNARQLDEDGYLVLPDCMGPDLLAGLRARIEAIFEEEGDRAGSEFKQEPGCRRLANLLDKGDIFQTVVTHSRLLAAIGHVLKENFKLSSLNVRRVNPFWDGVQPLHADMAAIADEHGFWVCNSVWLLDDFTLENGAIRAVPGSHHWKKLPQQELADPTARHPQERLLTGRAGTVMIMNAHLWHGGTANRTPSPRTALHAFFCRRDKPQQQYQRQLIRPEVQAAFSPDLRHLLALDDPLNDAVSTAVAVRSGFLK